MKGQPMSEDLSFAVFLGLAALASAIASVVYMCIDRKERELIAVTGGFALFLALFAVILGSGLADAVLGY